MDVTSCVCVSAGYQLDPAAQSTGQASDMAHTNTHTSPAMQQQQGIYWHYMRTDSMSQ